MREKYYSERRGEGERRVHGQKNTCSKKQLIVSTAASRKKQLFFVFLSKIMDENKIKAR
jgi:hypothetical protein